MFNNLALCVVIKYKFDKIEINRFRHHFKLIYSKLYKKFL